MKQSKRVRDSFLALIVGAASIGGSAAMAETFVVTPTQTFGWTFFQEGTPAATGFVDGPGTPPLGTGSARLTAQLSTDGPILFKTDYQGTKFSDITKLQYSTYRTSPADPSVLAISLQFTADSNLTDGDTSFQGRLVFEPYLSPATVNTGVWQTWDPMQGRWWGTGASIPTRPFAQLCPQSNPCTWPQVLANWPQGGIHPTDPGSVIFKAGSSWTNFDGNVDAFTIGIGGVEDTYNFDLYSTPTDKDQCKNGGYKNFNPPSGPYRNQGQCVSAANHQ